MDVYISWSGEDSKVVASSLKIVIEEFYSDQDVTVFVSESDIDAGKDWYQVIKQELNACKIGILCLTPLNADAPWLCFEAGAMAMTYEKEGVIPLLLMGNAGKPPAESPLSALNYVQWSHDGFCRILRAVAKVCGIRKGNKVIKNSSKGYFEEVDKCVEEIVGKGKRQVTFGRKSIFPKSIGYYLRNSVFLCGPMASLVNDEAYVESRQLMLNIARALQEAGLSPAYYGGEKIERIEDFDGSIKSVKENFKHFKQSECVLVVYPEALPSSVLVEIGYAIALSKPTVIFTSSRECLPFLLKDIDGSLPNVSVFEYGDSQEIIKKIRRNGSELFPRE